MAVFTRWTRIGDAPNPRQGLYECVCGARRYINDKNQTKSRASVG